MGQQDESPTAQENDSKAKSSQVNRNLTWIPEIMGPKDPKSSSQTSFPTCVDTWEKHRRKREQPERMHFSHRETEYYLKELIKLSNYFFFLP